MPLSRNWFRSWFVANPTVSTRRCHARLSVDHLESRDVPSTIQGTVFNDGNRDAIRDSGETGLAGWTVYLDVNRNSVLDAGDASTVTDVNGAYLLDMTNEPPSQVGQTGTIRDYVAFVLPVGEGGRWINTSAGFAPVNRNTEPDAVRNFGAYFQPFVGTRPVGSETRVNVTTTGVQGNVNDDATVKVAADAAGNYVIVWPSAVNDLTDTITARVFNANGTPRTGEIVIGTANKKTSTWNIAPQIDMAGDGRFVVAWSNYNAATNSNTTFARVYQANGSPNTGPVTVLPGDTKTTSVVIGVGIADNGQFVVMFRKEFQKNVWTEERTLQVQRYQANGSVNGKVIQVTSLNLINGGASFAMDAGGRFIALWEESSNGSPKVNAQRYDAAGKKIGSLLSFASGPGVNNSFVAMNAAGQFVITHLDSQGQRVARVYHANGTVALAPVTFAGAGDGSRTQVAIDEAGNVVFTWTDTRSPTPGTTYAYAQGEIRYRRLTASGVLEPEQIVNTTTQGEQSQSSVAMTGNGTFVVVWQGYGLDDESGIFAQQFGLVEN